MLIIFLLGGIWIQDMRYRAVSWFLFPIVALGLGVLRWLCGWNAGVADMVLVNLSIVLILLLSVQLYLILRERRLVPLQRYLGLGDILFLLIPVCYFSVLNFIVFLIISLLGTLVLWGLMCLLQLTRHRYVPLAGLQALILIFFLILSWWILRVNPTDDYWLQPLYFKYAA